MLAVASNKHHMRAGVGYDIGKCIIIMKMSTRPNYIIYTANRSLFHHSTLPYRQ